MKLKTTIIILLSLIAQNIYTQNCQPATAVEALNINNVKADIKNGGDLWWDGVNGGYIFPKPAAGSGLPEVSAIFAGGLWMGGYDLAGNLKIAASTYGAANGTVDFFAGPLSDIGLTDFTQCGNFDYIWTMNADDIKSQILDKYDNGIIDGPIPWSVLAWPGNGNPEFAAIFGFDLPEAAHDLAPFEDVNWDGIYNPNDGDYPDINGADQAYWTLFNDAGNIHQQSEGELMRMQIQLLAYSYASNITAINNATFYDYTFINQAVESLDSVHIGLWLDPDLGCYTDDFVGCFPEDNMAFIYNEDAIDGTNGCSCAGGVNSYCEEIPVVGIKILRGVMAERVFDENGNLVYGGWGSAQAGDTLVEAKMTSFMVIDSSTAIPPGSQLDVAYFSLLSGTWPDGTPQTSGGNGYNPGSTNYANYTYPGNPSDDTEWSMCSTNTTGGDFQMLMGIGPFRMQPGQIKTMSFAVIAAENVAHPCPDMTVLQDVGNQVCDFYDNNFILTNKIPTYNESSLSLSPNPFTSQTRLILDDANEQLQHVQLFSITGQLLRSYSSLSTNSLTIEKGNLTTGMYIYKALAKDGKAYSGKIIVR